MIRIFVNHLPCASSVWNTGLMRHLHINSVNYGAKPLSITYARNLINLLNESERAILLSELQKCRHSHGDQDPKAPPSSTNVVSSHDETAKRSLSRIAAGLGNLVSDMFGIGMVNYVERFAARFGVHLPENMTAEEMASRSVRWCTIWGRLTGITIGCLLGLLPLLFFPETSSGGEKPEKHQTPSS